MKKILFLVVLLSSFTLSNTLIYAAESLPPVDTIHVPSETNVEQAPLNNSHFINNNQIPENNVANATYSNPNQTTSNGINNNQLPINTPTGSTVTDPNNPTNMSLATASQVPSVEPEYIPDDPYGFNLCRNPKYTCIAVPPGETWAHMFPNEEKRQTIQRLNRTNVALKYRNWLLVPRDWKNFDYMSASPFPDHIDNPREKLLMVDLNIFAFAAYNEQGYLVYWGPATGGKEWCEDVNRSCESALGTYRIYRVQGPDCKSSKYPMDAGGGASMPYCMHYFQGFAIHGSTLSGFVNRSYGCVRLFDDDAKWLNQQFVSLGTKVIVKH